MDKKDCISWTHLKQIRDHYEASSPPSNLTNQYHRILARYYEALIPPEASILEIGCGTADLLRYLPNQDITGIDLSEKQIERAKMVLPKGKFMVMAGEELDIPDRKFDVIILSETLNHAEDIQKVLENAAKCAHDKTRLICNIFSSLWRPVIQASKKTGLHNSPEYSWISPDDLKNMMSLSGWEVFKSQPRILYPLQTILIERLFNRWFAPLLPFACMTNFFVARLKKRERQEFSVSIIVPARNEAGNIENAILRTPNFGTHQEFIFIEGGSSDNTFEKILEVKDKYPDCDIKVMKQSKKGKANAVQEAFEVAGGELFMILDADLTMPPEDLPKYYEAIASGEAEFANGVRLVYPMEGKAMRFLNMCANKAFSILFSWVLTQPVKDTLCGTKVLHRDDYAAIVKNRSFFGEFDPYGDFDLIFGAEKLNMKIVDIPIRYRDRVYGDTNINRWSGGWLLLKMLVFAARKLKFI